MEELPTLKILTLGDSSVGKTSLLFRFADNQFTINTISTIGIEYKSKVVKVLDKQINLQVWDTAGQEHHHSSISTTFYRRAHGIVLVYDLDNPTSFQNVNKWIKQIENKTGEAVLVLVGNKLDLGQEGCCEAGEQFAQRYKIPFVPSSAKTGYNVNRVFELVAEIILRDKPHLLKNSNTGCKLKDNKLKKPPGCCRT